MTRKRGPHRSNQPLSIRRAIKAQHVVAGIRSIRRKSRINWTEARLRKLVPTVFDSAATERGRHFARAVAALRAWPAMSREQMLTQATREYYEKDAGRWVWRPDVLDMMRDYQRRAPVDTINTEKLRGVLADIGIEEAQSRFMAMLLDDLERRPVTNLRDIRFLRQLRERHNVFVEWLGEACGQPHEIHGHRAPTALDRGFSVNGLIPNGVPRRASTLELMKEITAQSVVIDYPDWAPRQHAMMPTDVRRHRFIPPKPKKVIRSD